MLVLPFMLLTNSGCTAPTQEASQPVEGPAETSGRSIGDGTYLVGTDIPAGKYKGTVAGGTGYWQVSRDANGNDIVANGNPVGQFYLECRDGEYLQLSGVTIARVGDADTVAKANGDAGFGDGTYLVGTDLPPGTYKGSVSAGTGYWQVSKDANGNDIVANDNPAGQFYLSCKKGQYVQLSAVRIARFTKSSGASGQRATRIGVGTYLVGTDIPAGKYKGTVVGDSGYWQVSTDANGNDIVANDNPAGQFYLSCADGQFVRLSDVQISRVK